MKGFTTEIEAAEAYDHEIFTFEPTKLFKKPKDFNFPARLLKPQNPMPATHEMWEIILFKLVEGTGTEAKKIAPKWNKMQFFNLKISVTTQRHFDHKILKHLLPNLNLSKKQN